MTLQDEIMQAINRHSAENGSNTPDWILARYLTLCLHAFDGAVREREKWYGRDPVVGPAGIRTDGSATDLDPPFPPAPTPS